MNADGAWEKAWAAWKVLLFIGVLGAAAAVMTVYFEGGLFPILLISVVGITAGLYWKAK